MIVHGSSLSPFVRKVMIFADEKGVPLQNVPGAFGDKSPERLVMSPFGKIPAFEDGDYKLADSSAICHYIDAKHPEHRLIPTEPKALGKAIWFDEFADTILMAAAGVIFFNRCVAPLVGMPGDLAAAAKAEAEALPPVFAYLERTVPDAGKFLVGDALTIADISVGTMFVNLQHAGVAPDSATHPRMAAWVASILARPSFAALVEQEKRFLPK